MHQTLDIIQLQKDKFTFEDGVREQLGSTILPGCRHHRTHPQLLSVTSIFINVLMNKRELWNSAYGRFSYYFQSI